MQLWIVGQLRFLEHICADGAVTHCPTWEIQGVFLTEERARVACRNRAYFYAPLTADQELPDEQYPWEGVVYPHAEATT